MRSKWIYLFYFTLLAVTALAQAKTAKYSLEESHLNHPSGSIAKSSNNQILFHYQWINFKDLNTNMINLLSLDLEEDQEILITSFNFYLPRNFESYNPEIFHEISLLEELSGMKYKKLKENNKYGISFKPHPFKTIKATSLMMFPQNFYDYQDSFHLESTNEQILVHQKIDNFSDYLDQTDIIIQIIPEGDGTRFTVHSLGALNQNESQSSLLSITKSAMVSKMKDQMMSAPSIYQRH